MKKVSIIIPCYNVEKYLERCLNSVLNQTYKNFEILLINDGSTDNTEEACLKFTNENKNVRYFKKENGGASSARNLGLDNATGDYISFIDADDSIEPEFLEKLVSNFKEGDSFCVYNGINKINNDIVTKRLISDECIPLLLAPSVCLRIFSKKGIDELNLRFENSSMGEDLEFTAKMLIHNSKYTIVDGYYYNYFSNSNSLTHTRTSHIYTVMSAIERVEEFAKKEKKYDEFYSTLEFMNIYHIFKILLRNIYRNGELNNKTIDEIYLHVSSKYNDWIHNEYITVFDDDTKKYLQDLYQKKYELVIEYLKRIA